MSTKRTLSDGDETIAEALGRVTGSALSDDAKVASMVAEMVSQNYRDYAGTTQTLIESYQADIAELRATLGAIRQRIGHLLSGPYMPTPAVLLDALYPDPSSLRIMDPKGNDR